MYFIFLLLLLLLVLIRINNVGVKICLNRFFFNFCVNRGICVVSRACAGKVPSPPSTTQAGSGSSSSNNDSGSGGGCIISNSDNDDDDDDNVPRDWESLHNSHWLPRASASSRIGPSNAAASASAAFARRNALGATPTPSTSSSSAVNAAAAAALAVEEEEDEDEDEEDHLRPGPSRWIGYYDAASLYPSSGTCSSTFIHSFIHLPPTFSP